ncbi:M28 family metallopeptidase [Arthrobacter sp. zg-Y820]|uniref:M28 family metallopeptidase n=1 Tax=unclassified Arthrobacter TaxID=235627 RepID=UPI001E44140C|nr:MULTISPECIES: M28 family metallopeptidase [unclassified Arthrobacter]MCC9198038.1 M28 family metallopeptidase [Arthrobacter sp. zg-Y820]MDK1280905.1 M28 family metallopeptidase [Arthrobacter sp. zg.Y820]WIB10383.1 M28 family metallopeptidase [Arthrobacter sp. zg-Y820]
MKTQRTLRGAALAAAVVLAAGTAAPVYAAEIDAAEVNGAGVGGAGYGSGQHPGKGKPGYGKPGKPGKPEYGKPGYGKPGKPGYGKPVKDESAKLRSKVTVKNVFEHLEELQEAADVNGGNRAAGTPGYEASAQYIESELRRAGYRPVRQEFTYGQFELLGEALEQTAPTPTVYTAGTDFTTMTFSGAGDVTAAVTPVDINLAGDRVNTSGCEPEDFIGFAAGDIALLQRGECDFAVKVQNAADAGAAGAVLFNQGNTEERSGILNGTLGAEAAIPAVSATFALGEALAGTPGAELRIAVDSAVQVINSFNVLADTRTGDPERTVVVGAHLDSVAEGPGINDNGSGSAAVLETAVQLAKNAKKNPLENRVRFAFWGSEEDSLIGSNHYVSQLDEAGIAGTLANLNFDMVGSPNFVRFVYDGDGDAFDLAGPEGSAEIESVFEEYFASQSLESAPTEFSGRSDYSAFITAGIPAGGLFSGAEDIKTEEEAALFGGTAGEAYDSCYHQACDDLGNVSWTALDQMSDAVAHSVLTFARTEADLRGGAGVDAQQRTAPAGPELQYRGDVLVK